MFFPKVVFCRVFQTAFRMALPLLPYREPEIVSSCFQLGSVISKEGMRSALIVTDKGVVGDGLVKPLETVLQSSGVDYAVYSDTQPNPTVKNVEDALALYRTRNCDSSLPLVADLQWIAPRRWGRVWHIPKERSINWAES